MLRAYSDLEGLTGQIIRCAIEVHRVLGPGLLESVYEACLLAELRAHGLTVACQVRLPIRYKEIRIESELIIDLMGLLINFNEVLLKHGVRRLDRPDLYQKKSNGS
jgi:hypothetical protein